MPTRPSLDENPTTHTPAPIGCGPKCVAPALLASLEAIARCGHAYFDRDQKKIAAMIHLADAALAQAREARDD